MVTFAQLYIHKVINMYIRDKLYLCFYCSMNLFDFERNMNINSQTNTPKKIKNHTFRSERSRSIVLSREVGIKAE